MTKLIINTYNGIKNSKFLCIVLASAVFFVIALFINFQVFKINDPDGFYHFRHAWLYRTNGIFDTSFPWVQYSMINKLGGDLWYGFHLFLIPFTYFNDPILGIKIAGVVITWLALFLYFLSFYRLKLAFPIFWATFLPFADLYMLARLSVTRPHPLSMGLNMLLFSFLIQGGLWPVFLVSFMMSFIHLNLSWIPVLTLLVISIGRVLNKKPLEFNKAFALLGGIIAGAFLKPHPIAALKLNYIQLIDIILVKMQKIKLNFGNELYPAGPSGFSYYLLPFFIVMIMFFLWLVYKKHLDKTSLTDKIAMWTLLLLTTVFLVLTVFTASRAMDFFMSYFLMFAAFNITFYLSNMKGRLKEAGGYFNAKVKQDLLGGAIVVSIILFIILNDFLNFGAYRKGLELLPDPYRFENSSKWLELNTKPGEIVFHLGWDAFPELFFWNQHDYYINGMDPIFMYKYNPNLYWEYHFLAINQGAEYTCSYRKCDKNTAVKTYDVLINHFKATYVIVWPPNYHKFFEYLESNPDKFERVFVGQSDAVYKIKRSPNKR